MTPRQEAKAQSLTHYFTGKACKYGHVSKRFISTNQCCQCHLERSQRPEVKAYDAKRLKTPKARAQKAEYRQDNAEQIAAYNAEHYKANTERYAARQATHAKANPHLYSAAKAKRRAAKLQATPMWVDFKAIRAIYKQCAERTKTTGIPHAVDHIYPLVSNAVCGLHVAANLQILTASENSSKHNKLPAPEQIPSELE